MITGFLLESELNENGQDAVERRIVNQSIVPEPVDGLAYPGATAPVDCPRFGPVDRSRSAFLDNGMYNLGVRPIDEDLGRGGNDAFGWPLSLSALMMKNLGGPDFNPGGDNAGRQASPSPQRSGIAMTTSIRTTDVLRAVRGDGTGSADQPGMRRRAGRTRAAADVPYLAPSRTTSPSAISRRRWTRPAGPSAAWSTPSPTSR